MRIFNWTDKHNPQARTAFWTEEGLRQYAEKMEASDLAGNITQIFIEPLGRLAMRYMLYRKHLNPKYRIPQTHEEAFNWVLSELAEIAEARNHELAEWDRNHPGEEHTNVNEEIGDLFFMGFVLAELRGIDPIEQMLKKFQSKGFEE